MIARLLLILLAFVPAVAFAADAPTTRPAFVTADVILDSGDKRLAAWQVELKAQQGNVKIVGVEGGDHRDTYRDPPYYDPAALTGGRIILASFTTNDAPPKGRVVVARVHLQAEGGYRLMASTTAAADTAGKPVEARAFIATQTPKE